MIDYLAKCDLCMETITVAFPDVSRDAFLKDCPYYEHVKSRA